MSDAAVVPTRRRRAVDLQETLRLTPRSETATVALHFPRIGGPRAIEDEAFPFEALSNVAEIESWRKEINRLLFL